MKAYEKEDFVVIKNPNGFTDRDIESIDLMVRAAMRKGYLIPFRSKI